MDERNSREPRSPSSPEEASESPPRRTEIRPRPNVPRIRRTAVALAGITGLCLLMLLTLRYSRQSLSQARHTAPPTQGPPAADVENIERYEPPAAPVDLEPPPPSDVAPVRRSTPRPHRPHLERSRALDAAYRSKIVAHSDDTPSTSPADGPSSDSVPWGAMLEGLDSPLRRETSSSARPSLPAVSPPEVAVAPGRNLLSSAPSDVQRAVRQPPASPYLLRAGSWLPAALAHRVASDQPGLLRAVVTQDVHDSVTGRHLLIPRGTVLLGSQGDLPSLGQDRLAIVWHRLQFPDGTSLDLADGSSLPSASLDGSAGVRGQTDHHWGRRYGAAVLLSLVGAGLQISQPARSLDRAISPGETAAGAAGLELGRLSQTILRQYTDLPPTIQLHPGTRIYAVLTGDLAFNLPYLG